MKTRTVVSILILVLAVLIIINCFFIACGSKDNGNNTGISKTIGPDGGIIEFTDEVHDSIINNPLIIGDTKKAVDIFYNLFRILKKS